MGREPQDQMILEYTMEMVMLGFQEKRFGREQTRGGTTKQEIRTSDHILPNA
jgi:hypothetical protein